MKKNVKYVCTECGSASPQWLGKCPYCGTFGALVERAIDNEHNTKTILNPTKPQSLNEIQNQKFERVSTGIGELDGVLGGGIVPYSIVLIGGDPGVGKSTILTQVFGNIAKNKKVLYVSAEESLSQVKLRASRLNVDSNNFYVLNENKLENIEAVMDEYEFVVIDSIQTVYLENVTGSAGSIAQVRECASKLMNIAKSKRKTIFIIGHVTKDGAIAGPKVLEHIMDAVLYFEGDLSDNFKILRAVKNRFGSQQEVGVFEMTDKGVFGVNNYNGIFMSDNRGKVAGSIVTPSLSGNRCMPVEIQSLVSKTVFGMPRRMPLGIDYNKMALSIAVLERKCYIPFYNQDVYINAMGGIKLSEPAVDLAICLSLASANKNIPIEKSVTAFGEVGLTSEVRPVLSAEKRVADAIKFGFKTVILPKQNYEAVKKFEGSIKIVTVSYLSQAIKFLFDGKDENNFINNLE